MLYRRQTTGICACPRARCFTAPVRFSVAALTQGGIIPPRYTHLSRANGYYGIGLPMYAKLERYDKISLIIFLIAINRMLKMHVHIKDSA